MDKYKLPNNFRLSAVTPRLNLQTMLVDVQYDPIDVSATTGAERFDLHADPGAIARIEAAREHAALANFLALVNANESIFATIGCKRWDSTEPEAAEPFVCASRVGMIFLCEATNFGPGPHEDLAHKLAALLQREKNEALRAELQIVTVEFAGEDSGFGLRITLYARGNSPEQAELRWALGLAHVQKALLFIARTLRQSSQAMSPNRSEPG
jgi:hypothetical protein